MLLSFKSPLIRSSSLHPPRSWQEQTGSKMTETNKSRGVTLWNSSQLFLSLGLYPFGLPWLSIAGHNLFCSLALSQHAKYWVPY